MFSEVILKVGKKGEIYTTKEVRKAVGIKPGGSVRAVVKGSKLIIEPLPTVEDLIRDKIVELTPNEVEKISEELQKERGVYG